MIIFNMLFKIHHVKYLAVISNICDDIGFDNIFSLHPAPPRLEGLQGQDRFKLSMEVSEFLWWKRQIKS